MPANMNGPFISFLKPGNYALLGSGEISGPLGIWRFPVLNTIKQQGGFLGLGILKR